MITIENKIKEYNNNFFTAIESIDLGFIVTLKNAINNARKDGKQVFLLGNGGSAASSSHWVCDFSKNITLNQERRLHIQSLVDNIPLGTALSNDCSFDLLFSEQLTNYMDRDDIVIGLSVSGNSPNLVNGLEYAFVNGGVVFSIIGDYGGRMKDFSHHCEIIKSTNYGVVEDAHMYFCHVISEILKEEAEKR